MSVEMRPQPTARPLIGCVVATAVIAPLVLLMGCGGIADLSSGLPPAKLGEELSASELEQLCRAIEGYTERHPMDETAGCRGLGLSSTSGTLRLEDTKYVCQSGYESCISDGGPLRTFCDGLRPEDYTLRNCTSTVAEIEDCLAIDIVRTTEIANDLRYCDEIDLDYVAQFHQVLFPEMRTPEGCELVRQNCPAVL
jgi:hypothetical protein